MRKLGFLVMVLVFMLLAGCNSQPDAEDIKEAVQKQMEEQKAQRGSPILEPVQLDSVKVLSINAVGNTGNYEAEVMPIFRIEASPRRIAAVGKERAEEEARQFRVILAPEMFKKVGDNKWEGPQPMYVVVRKGDNGWRVVPVEER